ncbi:hypothetical protein D3C84_988990 [compost metagenome]
MVSKYPTGPVATLINCPNAKITRICLPDENWLPNTDINSPANTTTPITIGVAII